MEDPSILSRRWPVRVVKLLSRVVRTDVTRCAERTFIAYIARCACGWLSNDHPANPDGYHTCHHELINNHLG
jgi:hypothetical protein